MKTKKGTTNKIQIIKFCIAVVFGAAIYIVKEIYFK